MKIDSPLRLARRFPRAILVVRINEAASGVLAHARSPPTGPKWISMKTVVAPLIVALLVLASPSMVAAQKSKKATDQELSELLIGKWQVQFEDPKTKRKSIGWTVYAKGGLAASRSITKVGDKEVNLVLQAKWKIEKGVLITTITKSSDPKLVKEASVTKDRIVSMSTKQFRYIDRDGKTITEIRVPDDKP